VKLIFVKIFINIIFLLFVLTSYSQDINEKNQLALQYFNNKEYEKAESIFLDLYNSQKNKTYFAYYLRCLKEQNKFEEAEKIIKKEIRKNENNLTYYVDLGYFYKIQDKISDSEDSYSNAIKLLQPNNNQITNLANAFLTYGEFNYAEQTYLKGRKLLKDVYGFNFELANIYQAQHLWAQMINEYLDLLDLHESYIQTVQNRLQNSVYTDKENNLTEVLKTQLIKRIQKEPDKTIFSELLIWLYLQERKYEGAYIQSIALDKRLKEDGSRIMELARQAADNKNYDVALKSYKYVSDKGNENAWFNDATSGYMSVLYTKITEKPGVQYNEIVELENQLQNTLNELGTKKTTFNLIKALANIKALYLNKTEESTTLLENTIKANLLSPLQVAECKLLLGDILLYNSDPWGATVYYAQVEKAFDNEPIGHEAKFKKAKLAYYTGDFLWAQAQLDVLKASTSKLIANDAFSLSLFISSNLTTDSTSVPLRMYSKSELLIYQKKDSEAISVIDSIITKYKTNEISANCYYTKGEILLKKGNYTGAVLLFDSAATNYTYSLIADNAIFQIASIYDYYIIDKAKAMEYYQKIINNYSNSTLVNFSRQRFRILRGDKIPDEEMIYLDSQPF